MYSLSKRASVDEAGLVKAALIIVAGLTFALIASLLLLFVPVVAAGATASACMGDTTDLTAPGPQGDTGNAEYIWSALLDDGLTPEAAAGVLGNLHQETGGSFDPHSVQAGGPGRGIAQWSEGERWDQLVAWAQGKGLDEWSLQTQVTWMLKEMHQGWGSFSMDHFKTMTDVVEATIYFHDRFEASADSADYVRTGRGGFAQDWYTRLKGKPVNGSAAGGAGPVFIVGDSLTVGSTADIESAYHDRRAGVEVTIAAGEGWHTSDGLAALHRPKALAAKTWVVALGTNDDPGQFRTAAAKILQRAGDRQVVWINVARPQGQEPVNDALSQLAEQHQSMQVLDFASLAAARPDSFTADGVHMTPAGYRWRAALYVVRPADTAATFDSANCVGGSGGTMSCPQASKSVLPADIRSHMQPNAVAVADCVAAGWPEIKDMSPSWRPSDPYPDHPSGQAVDIMMPQGCADTDGKRELGGQIAAFLVKYADEYRVKYLIWRQRIWRITEGPKPWDQWEVMGNRGGCTANHEDHVHVTVDGPDPAPGGFTYEYKTPDTGTRPCPPRIECGSSEGGSWVLPTKSGDWKTEATNPGNDPGNTRGAPNDHGRCHAGWDIAAPSGQRIVAAAAGRAHTAVDPAGAGNYVTIDHGGGVQSLYMHMTNFAPDVDGAQVQAGQLIGYVGSTGHSTGPHLHFEVRVNGTAKDPRHWVLPGRPLQDAC